MREYCDQWIRKRLETYRPSSGRPHQTNIRQDLHVICHTHLAPTSSLYIIQTYVVPSLKIVRIIAKRVAEEPLASRCPLCLLPMSHDVDEMGSQLNGTGCLQ